MSNDLSNRGPMITSVLRQSTTGVNPPFAPKGLSAKLCLSLARAFTSGRLTRFSLRRRAPGARFESQENYLAQTISRAGEKYRGLFAEFSTFSDKSVLELGCSSGYLLAEFLAWEQFHALGADIDADALARGRSMYGDKITFLHSSSSSIPLPDASVDIIYTIDTVEHLSRPQDIFNDCCRILKPGGTLLIHFDPWLSPWGAHLDDIIPFPWPHLVFSMDTLLSVAAYLYQSDEYVPACYWFDPETGTRRENPYMDRRRWDEFLNRMTLRQFIRLVKTLPLRVVHVRRVGFSGRAYSWARVLKGLAQVPVLNEFFSSSIFCVLEKPR